MTKLLEFRNISRHFDRNSYHLQASGSLEEGGILAIRGASGAGKSTLLKILARLLAPEKGEMFYRGEAYQLISPPEWRREIQYLAQKPVIFEGSVEDNLRLPFTLNSILPKLSYSDELVLKYLEGLGLPQEMLNQQAGTISGGEAARVALIRSLLLQPNILLLDEPTAYLDELSAGQVLRLLKEWLKEQSSRGLVIVSHKQDELQGLAEFSFLDL